MTRLERELLAIALYESHARSLAAMSSPVPYSWEDLTKQQRDAWRASAVRLGKEAQAD